ncbi:hypothetical protein DAI22_12g042000 [Oryza sativa Japonica Group]|nr:hypothetical protein DAI22_12g042000 [Oryza sativa Japonica Group]
MRLNRHHGQCYYWLHNKCEFFQVGEDKICQAINKRNEEGDVGLKATSAPPPTVFWLGQDLLPH